jgi:hypothetical protein
MSNRLKMANIHVEANGDVVELVNLLSGRDAFTLETVIVRDKSFSKNYCEKS